MAGSQSTPDDGSATRVLGRDAEIVRLDAWVSSISTARGHSLVVAGEPGIGKSTLLERTGRQAAASGLRVLAAQGVETEQHLAFAALADVLRPVQDHLRVLPPSQREALEAALALGPAAPTDPFVVCVATLSLLAAAARDTPIAVIVDDAHFLDPASAQVLGFVGRRIEHDRFGLLTAVRTDEPSAFDPSDFPQIQLGGLPTPVAAELVAEVCGRPVAPDVVDRIVVGTGANPLALRELASSLTAGELEGEVPLGDPLTVGPTVQRALSRRIEELDGAARGALLVAATDSELSAETVLGAAAKLGFPASAFERAERAGLLALREGRFSFRHQLIRSAVYHGATPADVRAAHAAIAAAIDPAIDPSSHAWHLSDAAVGHDDGAAAALDQAAQQAFGRGAYASAARASERAAELSARPDDAHARWRAAGNAAHLAGELATAVRLYDEAVASAPDEFQRGLAVAMRAAPRYWLWPTGRQLAALSAEAPLAAVVDPSLAGMLEILAGACAVTEGDVGRARAAVDAAIQRWQVQGPVRDAARALEATVDVIGGRRLAAVPVLVEIAATLGVGADPVAQWTRLICAQSLTWAEQHEQAAAVLNLWIAHARAEGRAGDLPYPLAMRAEIDHRVGAWDRAWSAAVEAVELAEQTGQHGLGLGYCLMVLGQIEAGRGPDGVCRQHVEQAMALAAEYELHAFVGYGQAALGLLELALGNPEAAARALGLVAAAAERHGPSDPNQLRWRSDYIEALALVGRVVEAAAQLGVLETEAAACQSPWGEIAAARCRGLLAHTDQVAVLQNAVGAADATPYLFDQARARLLLGQALRRARRPTDARAPLEVALAQFSLLGADPWTHRTAAELRAVGAMPTAEHPGALHALSSQEMRIALAIADGATNREAASRLFLSPRTVEFHLGRIYRKLGVRTRTELASRVRQERVD